MGILVYIKGPKQTESKLKYLILIYALISFNSWGVEDSDPCNNNCKNSTRVDRAYLESAGIDGGRSLILLGENFSNCPQLINVFYAGEKISVTTSNQNQIMAVVPINLQRSGANKIIIEKNACPLNRYNSIDLTTDPSDEGISRDDFTTRESAPVDIFPFSYVDVEVNCLPEEKAISGGFKYSTWEVRTVQSYPSGTKWIFKAYNNSDATSMGNVFYAECVK